MKVKCIFNRGENLPQEYLNAHTGYNPKTEFSIIKDKIYVVYGIICLRFKILYLICDEDYMYYPIGNPAPLFEVIDNKLSMYWVLNYCRKKDYFEIVFKEWFQESYYYDKLTDGETSAVSIFQKYKKVLDAEANIEEDIQKVINWLSKPLKMEDQEHGWYAGNQKEVLRILKQLQMNINKAFLFDENMRNSNLLQKTEELGVNTGELYELLNKISNQVSDLKCT